MDTEIVYVLVKATDIWDGVDYSPFRDLLFASESKWVAEEVLSSLVDGGSDENHVVEYEIEELLLI